MAGGVVAQALDPGRPVLDPLGVEEDAPVPRVQADVVVGVGGDPVPVGEGLGDAPAEQQPAQAGRGVEHRRRHVVGVDLVAGEEQLLRSGPWVGACVLDQPVEHVQHVRLDALALDAAVHLAAGGVHDAQIVGRPRQQEGGKVALEVAERDRSLELAEVGQGEGPRGGREREVVPVQLPGCQGQAGRLDHAHVQAQAQRHGGRRRGPHSTTARGGALVQGERDRTSLSSGHEDRGRAAGDPAHDRAGEQEGPGVDVTMRPGLVVERADHAWHHLTRASRCDWGVMESNWRSS